MMLFHDTQLVVIVKCSLDYALDYAINYFRQFTVKLFPNSSESICIHFTMCISLKYSTLL